MSDYQNFGKLYNEKFTRVGSYTGSIQVVYIDSIHLMHCNSVYCMYCILCILYNLYYSVKSIVCKNDYQIFGKSYGIKNVCIRVFLG